MDPRLRATCPGNCGLRGLGGQDQHDPCAFSPRLHLGCDRGRAVLPSGCGDGIDNDAGRLTPLGHLELLRKGPTGVCHHGGAPDLTNRTRNPGAREGSSRGFARAMG